MQEMQERQSGQPARAELLAADDLARQLGVDRSTVYRMAADGRLPAVKVGRQWRFPRAAVQALMPFESEPQAGTSLNLDPAVVEPILEIVAESIGVMMVVTDMQGRPLTRVVNPCPWFAPRANHPSMVAHCVQEWRELAGGFDLEPRFGAGRLGFECARAFVRSGTELVGMVLAGGIDPGDGEREGLYELDPAERRRVLAALPKMAAALASLAGREARTPEEPAVGLSA